ncbi:MAG: hypothetical protein GEEBNDBF_02234 [bacterium]|nr:hypothetical protein [bacterium]
MPRVHSHVVAGTVLGAHLVFALVSGCSRETVQGIGTSSPAKAPEARVLAEEVDPFGKWSSLSEAQRDALLPPSSAPPHLAVETANPYSVRVAQRLWLMNAMQQVALGLMLGEPPASQPTSEPPSLATLREHLLFWPQSTPGQDYWVLGAGHPAEDVATIWEVTATSGARWLMALGHWDPAPVEIPAPVSLTADPEVSKSIGNQHPQQHWLWRTTACLLAPITWYAEQEGELPPDPVAAYDRLELTANQGAWSTLLQAMPESTLLRDPSPQRRRFALLLQTAEGHQFLEIVDVDAPDPVSRVQTLGLRQRDASAIQQQLGTLQAWTSLSAISSGMNEGAREGQSES